MKKRSEEHCRKISEAKMGHEVSEETRRKISERVKAWIAANPPSDELREKRRQRMLGNTNMLGRTASEETRAKLSAAKKGRVVSAETRKKISIAHTGKKLSDETKEKLRQASLGHQRHLGFKHSDETKAKLAEQNRNRTREQTRYIEDAEAVTRTAIHLYLNKHHPKTGTCERCGNKATDLGYRTTHYAFKYHPLPWTREREHYEELCPKCHGSDHPRAKSFVPASEIPSSGTSEL
jgi:hypothetical protein